MAERASDDLELVDRLLELVAERLAAGILARVDARADQLASDSAALNLRAAAGRLGISQRGVERLIASGRLPSMQVGRRRVIPLQAINHLLADGLSRGDAEREPRPLRRRA
ncbi:MAG: excisionase family DNA-binding protein [Chloroflexi bacterium]|nr:excisionase family DNA-binding protein [Chloroflexota bacterium]